MLKYFSLQRHQLRWTQPEILLCQQMLTRWISKLQWTRQQIHFRQHSQSRLHLPCLSRSLQCPLHQLNLQLQGLKQHLSSQFKAIILHKWLTQWSKWWKRLIRIHSQQFNCPKSLSLVLHSRPQGLLSNLRRSLNLSSSHRANLSLVNSSQFQLSMHLQRLRRKTFSLNNSSILLAETSTTASLSRANSSSMVVATTKEVRPITIIKVPISLLTWIEDPITMVTKTWCLLTSKEIKMAGLVWTLISTTSRRASPNTKTGTTTKVAIRCLCQSKTPWPCRNRRTFKRLGQTHRSLSPLGRLQKLQWCQLDRTHSPIYRKNPSNLPRSNEGEKASR